MYFCLHPFLLSILIELANILENEEGEEAERKKTMKLKLLHHLLKLVSFALLRSVKEKEKYFLSKSKCHKQNLMDSLIDFSQKRLLLATETSFHGLFR